jgi:hypothetical protein
MNAKSRIAVAGILTSSAAAALGSMPRMAAAEETALETKRPVIVVEVDRAPLQIDTATLRLVLGESIRAALAEAEKSERSARSVEVASAGPRNGG